MRRPKFPRLGADVAGVVEAVGSKAAPFKPGHAVFGTAKGSFAEYACAAASQLALKPQEISFEQAACLPIAGVTALQGLRDKGKVQTGQAVLINGAAGGGGPDRSTCDQLAGMLQNAVRSAFTSQKMPGLLAKINREDLAILSNLVQRGTVIPVVDRTYSLREVAEAVRHVESGQVHGKVVIAVT